MAISPIYTQLNTPKNYLYAKKPQQNASQTRSVETPPQGEKNSANPAFTGLFAKIIDIIFGDPAPVVKIENLPGGEKYVQEALDYLREVKKGRFTTVSRVADKIHIASISDYGDEKLVKVIKDLDKEIELSPLTKQSINLGRLDAELPIIFEDYPLHR